MKPAIETPLGKALRAHREGHPSCKGCPEYLDIANRATARRVVWTGPTAAHNILSIRESAA